MELTQSQHAVLSKYLAPGESTWEEVATRVSQFVAQAESTRQLQAYWTEQFLSILLPMKFIPGGSILANSAHGTQGLLNCFVLSAEDTIGDITKLVHDAMLTTKFRGGVGIHIGNSEQQGYIRPKNTPFSDGMALGPCAVLDMVSDCSKKLTTGNKARRGAFLYSMHWSHPDIWEFIQAKTQSVIDADLAKKLATALQSFRYPDDIKALLDEFDQAWVETHLSPQGKRDRRWHNANISVQLDDEFFALLSEVESLDDFETIHRFGALEYRHLDKLLWVKQLWDQIALFAHDTADPGLLFIDNAKRRSPIQDFITCTNPCLAGDTLVRVVDPLGEIPDDLIAIQDLCKPPDHLAEVGLADGPHVWIRDGNDTPQAVQFKQTREAASLLEVRYFRGAGVKSISTTHDHTFLVKSLGLEGVDCKISATLLAEGDLLVSAKCDPNQEPWQVVSVARVEGLHPVYCCTVSTTHSFDLEHLHIGNCGEIWLPPNSACNLGSIVIPAFVKPNNKIDFEDLCRTIKIAVRFLDNVLDVSKYATEDQAENVRHRYRQLGLGVMGWADYLKQARIPYDSLHHYHLIDIWGSIIANQAYRCSEELAKEKGACGVWREIENVRTDNTFEEWVLYDPDYTINSTYPGNKLPELTHFQEQHYLHQTPRRNSTVLSVAPTGSIAQLAGCSWAFEPDFGLTTWKQVFVDASTSQQQWVQILNPYVEALNLSPADREIVKQTGSLKGTAFAQENPSEAAAFAIAREISPDSHIQVQAKWQQWLDSSVSKTINLPAETSVVEIQRMYRLAHELGCKGITIYRAGTLESEPIKVGDQEMQTKTEYRECRSNECSI